MPKGVILSFMMWGLQNNVQSRQCSKGASRAQTGWHPDAATECQGASLSMKTQGYPDSRD